MSREQWGHGYWKGVKDAEKGKVVKKDQRRDENYPIDEYARDLLVLMYRFNQHKIYDKTLFPVRELIGYLEHFCGIVDGSWEEVYDYVATNNPYGCYITGRTKGKKENDFFVLHPANLRELARTECRDLWWEEVDGVL